MDYTISDIFNYCKSSKSPQIPFLQTGIAIDASEVRYDGSTLDFELHVTCEFSHAFAARFANLKETLVFVMEEPASAMIIAERCSDPCVISTDWSDDAMRPAFQSAEAGEDPYEESSKNYVEGYINIPFKVSIHRQHIEPSFYMRVCLHKYISNTLAFNLVKASCSGVARWRQSEDAALMSAEPFFNSNILQELDKHFVKK